MMSPARSAELETCFPMSASLSLALQTNGDGFAFGLAQRIGLGLAAALCHSFSEIGKQDREPKP